MNNYPAWTWDGYDPAAPDDQKLLLLYLSVFGRPEQIAAWREGRPFVAALADA